MPIKQTLAGFILVLCGTVHSAAQDSELLERARELLDQGQASAAFTLLEPAFERQSGTPEFDLLYGIAALDSGRPTIAVFAFERVLALEPDNNRARAELARAYFEMGENEASREEFTAIDQQSVPSGVARTIRRYLTEIDAVLAASRQDYGVFVEALTGYDSNVNAGTDISSIAIPAFGDLIFTLDESGREQDSGFVSLAGGGFFSAVVNDAETLRAFGSADASRRQPYNEIEFRTLLANAQLGLDYEFNQGNILRVSAFSQTYDLGGESNRDLVGANLQWLHNVGNRTQITAYSNFSVQRFPNQPVRDLNQVSGGLGAVHMLEGAGRPILFGSVYGGSDHQLRNDREDLGRTFIGVRVGAEYRWGQQVTLLGNVSYQHSRYGGDDPLFQERRRDNFLFLRAGVEYALGARWLVRPELQYSRNDSTLPVNDFDRWQTFLTMRYQL